MEYHQLWLLVMSQSHQPIRTVLVIPQFIKPASLHYQSFHKPMSLPFKSITYTVDRHYFLIQLGKTSLKLTIEDLDNKKRYFADVNNQVLSYPLDIQKLFLEIYKQYVHENKTAKRMLKYHDLHIVLRFDYPRCQFKQFKFPCTQLTTDDTELKLEILKQFFQVNREHIQQLGQRYLARMESSTTQQLEKINSAIDLKFEQITVKIDAFIGLKIGGFESFYNERQRQHESRLREEVQNSVKQVIADNSMLIREFHYMKATLENSILALAKNIDVVNENMEELRLEVDENREKDDKKLTNTCREIQETTGEIWKRLKQLAQPTFPTYAAEQSVSEDMFHVESVAKLHPEPEKTKFICKEEPWGLSMDGFENVMGEGDCEISKKQ